MSGQKRLSFNRQVTQLGETNPAIAAPPTVAAPPAVDYDTWQRDDKRGQPRERMAVRRFVKQEKNVLLDNYGAKFGRPDTACSSTCQHPWLPRTKLRADEIKAQKDAGELALLRTKVKIARKHVEEMNARREWLLQENIREQQAIMAREEQVHKDVYQLIQKYGKFRGAAESAQTHFERAKLELEAEVEQTRREVAEKTRVIRAEAAEMDRRCNDAENYLATLRTYKEKAFFENKAEIERLEKQIAQLSTQQARQLEDITQIVHIERGKLDAQRHQEETRLVADTAADYLDQVHFSWRQMAEENAAMRANIRRVGAECQALQTDNQALQDQIREWVGKPSVDTRTAVFPHLFPERAPCLPDDDIVLDIPTVKKMLVV